MGSEPQGKNNIELYLGYLKLEMNIMGILSAFCIAALALVLKETVGAEKGEHLRRMWEDATILEGSGLLLLLLAALAFYRQRSLLAYIYGWLCLSVVAPAIADCSQEEILKDADSWNTWRFYRAGFACIVAAMAIFFGALLQPMTKWPMSACGMISFTVVCIAIVGGGFGIYEYRLTKQDDGEATDVEPNK